MAVKVSEYARAAVWAATQKFAAAYVVYWTRTARYCIRSCFDTSPEMSRSGYSMTRMRAPLAARFTHTPNFSSLHWPLKRASPFWLLKLSAY